ncbi:hypothetical protein [Aporhodopirellula aestuarii]|uniref:Uncharacterized protein n=1 Tax=Aporhodopirellula aestuarii TaxID=2950107 RepID=A0ABT0U9P7_9BACT|nr:hypothetical protein [Aporhodopirellula aestuarii]MCM2373589.1 hypothetical protein [Aporhodopirellula aestuarii]
MATVSPIESMKRSYKLCLVANMVSIVLMFGSALLVEILSRRYNVAPAVDAEPSLLVSSYLVATRLALFVGLPAFLLAFVGMLRFQSWGRKLFTFLMLAWGLQILGFGIFNLSLTWGIARLFGDLGLLTAGAVLALSYLTSISELFAATKLTSPANGTGLSTA